MTPFQVAGAASQAIAAGEWRLVASDCTARFSVRDKLVTTVHGSLPVVGGSVHTSADGGLESARIPEPVRAAVSLDEDSVHEHHLERRQVQRHLASSR